MKAAVVDLYIEKGTDWSQTVEFYSDEEQTQPISFTGYTGRCKIRNLAGSVVAEPVVSFPTAGVMQLSLTNEKTSAIPTEGVLYTETTDCTYDVELVATSGGTVARWLNGMVTVSPEVTYG